MVLGRGGRWRMRGGLWIGLIGLASGSAVAAPIVAAAEAPLDQLIEQFNAGAPDHDGVEIEGWVEHGPDGPAVVIAVAPRGAVKLVADPGITVTPTERTGVAWQGPLPRRKVEPGIDYFTPPATVRLRFAGSDGLPVELRVEYAYCVVDFQCFLGEEKLTVATGAR
jgi:hypothetical protein